MTQIILLGGAAGTGKTTVAEELCRKMNFTHRLATGFIRETLRTATNNKVLDSHTFSVSDKPPFDHLLEQTKNMKDAINACINRCSKEGTSFILEGSNLIPGFIDNKNVTLSIMLYVDDYDTHRQMVDGKSHAKRRVSDEEFERTREIQSKLMELAKKHDVTMIDGSQELSKIIDTIGKMLK